MICCFYLDYLVDLQDVISEIIKRGYELVTKVYQPDSPNFA